MDIKKYIAGRLPNNPDGLKKAVKIARIFKWFAFVIGVPLATLSVVFHHENYYSNVFLVLFWGTLLGFEIRDYFANKEWGWAMSAIKAYEDLVEGLFGIVRVQNDTLKQVNDQVQAVKLDLERSARHDDEPFVN